MKRFIVIIAALLFSNVAAQAIDWQPLDTQTSNLTMYIDVDSIKYSEKSKDFFYAVRYTKHPRPEQVLYVKSDLYRDYAGIIRVDDYDYQTYKPRTMFRTSHVFMKPIEDIAFLYPAHEFVASVYIDENEPLTLKKIDNIIGNEKQKYKSTRIARLRNYIKSVDKKLDNNWNPPKVASTQKIVVNININADGSLNDYQFVTISNDEMLKRSIISAIEQTVPFKDLKSLDKDNLFIQITFKRGKHSKNVR